MKISRTSQFSGKTNEMEIDVTEDQILNWEVGGMLIQNAMPDLTADEREFIMTGATPDEWESMFSKNEQEEMNEDGS